jgi:hypothetical protein
MVTFAVKPPAHWLAVEYATEQPVAAAEAAENRTGVRVAAAERTTDAETASRRGCDRPQRRTGRAITWESS